MRNCAWVQSKGDISAAASVNDIVSWGIAIRTVIVRECVRIRTRVVVESTVGARARIVIQWQEGRHTCSQRSGKGSIMYWIDVDNAVLVGADA